MSNRQRGFVLLAAIVSSASVSGAQDPRVNMKLDAQTRVAVNAIIDSAHTRGLPTDALYQKVEEGYSKGANGQMIVVAVRNLAIDMASAHKALGTVASADEIKAGASAIHAGVPAVELGKMKKQGGLLRSLTLPFTVLTDIVSRGVPVGTAANAVRSLVGAGAKDKELNEFQRNVQDDIQQGAPPAAAAETRAKTTTEKKPDQMDSDR